MKVNVQNNHEVQYRVQWQHDGSNSWVNEDVLSSLADQYPEMFDKFHLYKVYCDLCGHCYKSTNNTHKKTKGKMIDGKMMDCSKGKMMDVSSSVLQQINSKKSATNTNYINNEDNTPFNMNTFLAM